MLTQTSEIAIRAMVFLTLNSGKRPISPRLVAEEMDCSPSYLAKVMGQLVRAGLMRSFRGSQGGMALERAPSEITLLDIVEACQGQPVAHYCPGIGDDMGPVCAFHHAMWDIRRSTMDALERWTLYDLAKNPTPMDELEDHPDCKMQFLHKDADPAPRSRS